MPHPLSPPWATAPAEEWSLTEIKQGVTVAQHSLRRACTFAGRAVGAVDIPLAHESCSRFHARLAFDNSSRLWLRDLNSTHGTAVNKRRIPAQACGTEESDSTRTGARGVQVFAGNVVQLGASTRLYCIEGPVTRRIATQQLSPAAQNTNKSNDTSIEDGRGDEPPESSDSFVPTKTSEKHHKEHEQIVALQTKLLNIQQESDRIQAKGELTQGQETQLQRNEQRVTELQQKIQHKQDDLNSKLQSVTSHRPQQESSVLDMNDDDEEEEEVDDRTCNRHEDDNELNPDGETEESLVHKWHSMQSQSNQLTQQIDTIRTNVKKLHDRVKDNDDFFLQNDIQIHTEQKEKLVAKQNELTARMVEVEQLLKIVNPKIQLHDRGLGRTNNSGAHDVLVKDHSFMSPSVKTSSMPPPGAASLQQPLKVTEMPPPLDFAPINRSESFVATAVFSRPEKRAKVQGPIMPFEALQSQPSSARSHQTDVTNSDNVTDLWRPPKDQDGSGRSKLNDKFGGKY